MRHALSFLAALLVAAPAAAQGVITAPTFQGTDGTSRDAAGVFRQLNAVGASAGTVPASSTAAEGGRVVKATAGLLYGLNVTTGAAGGFVLVLNTGSVPADGAVAPVKCYGIAPNTSADWNFRDAPLYLANGVVVVFSTGASCFTKTASATAFISGDAK